MSNRIPSKYQKDIFNFVKTGTGNCVINAVAGSGKTTTIIASLRFIPTDKSVIFLAFNKSIVEEIKLKVPENVKVQTFHSLGCSAIYKSYRDKSRLENNKIFDIINNITPRWSMIDKKEIDADYKSRVKKIVDLARLSLTHDEETLKDLCYKHQIDVLGLEIERALKIINDANNDISTFDFTDMIYWPAKYDHFNLEKYDYVFVDECQDLNKTQHKLIEKISHSNSRIVAVGDPAQCQPTKTQIYMSDGSIKNIEDLKVGDRVISYNNQKGSEFVGLSERYGLKIEEIVSRKYNDYLYEVISSGISTKYTPNHICVARFSENVNKDVYCVYLMKKGNWFRIGKTQLMYKGGFGLSYKCRTEGGEQAWILGIYNGEREALIYEQFYSYEFGIPQICFEQANTNVRNTEEIFEIYSKFKNLTERAINCLSNFKMDIKYPFYEKNKNYFSYSNSFEIYACNLFPKYMSVGHYKSENVIIRNRGKRLRPEWNNIDTINHIKYDGLVYSLKIEKYERYIADGILTHNCIYGFAGADTESFDLLTKMQNTITLPLSVNYRCGSKIIDLAKNFVSQIEAHDNAIEGILEHNASFKDVLEGDMVLCRNTAPLVKLCLEYLYNNKKSYVKGADIGEELIRLIVRSNTKTTDELKHWLDVEMKKVILSLKKKYPFLEDAEIKEHNTFILFYEKYLLINTIISNENLSDCNSLISKIRQVFLDNSTGICLSTIHKAKGLECNRVFILDREKTMPSKFAKLPWQKEQEFNLQYVAFTRAKNYLGFISDWSFYK